MTIDTSISTYAKTGLAIAEPTETGVKLITVFHPNCKAFLWQLYSTLIINKNYVPQKTYIVFVRNNFTAEEIKAILARLAPLEKAFGFLTSKITHVPRENAIVIEASARWSAHVNLFALLLSAIRYSNIADRNGYNFALTDIEKLKTWYAETCKKKPLKDGWQGVQHESGICTFLNVSIDVLGERRL